MHITLVTPYDPFPRHATDATTKDAYVGGVERVYAEVSRRMARRGHDVTLLCTTDGPGGQTEEDGVHVVRQPRRMTVLRAPVANLGAAIPFGTDSVQVAATYPFTTPSVLRAARRLGAPSVLDFHFEPAPGNLLGKAAAMAYRNLGPRSYPLADAVVVRSLAYARSAPSLRRVPEARWRVVPNGIDTARFRPSGPSAKPTDSPYILFVGRLVPYKGLEVLVRAVARNPPGIPVVIAGDGPLRAQLEGMAKGLGADVRFFGRVSDEDLPALYRGAELTVLPSVTQQEAFGIALIESMACGTPVVASDLPGVADVARLGGLVARRGDPLSLARQMGRILDGDAAPHGQALAKRVHAAYSWDAVTDRLLAVHQETVGAGDPGEATWLADPLGESLLHA